MEDVAAGELERSRCAEIHRRWPHYGWDYLGRSRWESWTAEPFLGFGIAGALIAAMYFEFTLLTGKAEPWFAALSALGLHPTGRAVILLLTAINAWTMDRWLASRMRGDRSLSMWLRLLRPLTAGVPVLGLASVPAWRWIAESRPAWAFHTRPLAHVLLLRPGVPGRLARAEIWTRTHSQRLPELVVWLIACQIAPFLGSLSWLAGNGPLDSSRRFTLQVVCAVLHLTAALFGAWYPRSQMSKLSFRLLPWLLLLPGLGILSILLTIPRSAPTREQRLLAATASEHRQVRVLPSKPLLGVARGAGDGEAHRLAFFRLKAALLAVDAAALAWFAGRTTEWRLGPDLPGSQSEIMLLLLPALPGLLLAAACLLAQWTGMFSVLRDMGRHLYGPFLALVPVVAMSGLLIGSLQARGSTPEVGLCLFAIALSAVLVQILSMSLSVLTTSPAPSGSAVLLGMLLWTELIELSGFLIYQPATPLARSLAIAFVLTPVWSLGLFLALGRWLLRPFTLRHLADPRLPFRNRAILAGVALTAALPLGGVAIPFWIYAHHRLWPGMERSWAATLS
jgi:hypothetical protein